MRGRRFLAGLSFGNVKVLRFESKSYQPAPRLKSSLDAVEGYSESAVDQKTTTSLISHYVMLYGDFITKSIFKHIADLSMKKKALPAYTWANEQIINIIKKLDIVNKNFVIINLRASIKANKDQDFTRPQLYKLARALKLQDIQMVILDVGSEEGMWFSKRQEADFASNMAISVFPDIEGLHRNFGKFPHIFLLQQLSRFNTCLGVIGNTSGTLDIAAFMGIRTLCLHKFKATSSRNIKVPYQDLRILLQANTMSVYDPAMGLDGLANFVNKWINYKQHILCHNQVNVAEIRLENRKFDLEHAERKCFAVDSNGDTANKVFLPQYKQVKCDLKLSGVMGGRLTVTNNAKPAVLKAYSKDDSYVPRQARSSS